MVGSKTSQRNGYLFVLEGIDGAGKTCVCDLVTEELMNSGYSVIRLREPTSESEWGKEIRERSPRGELSPSEELELFIRDREWHVQNRINPALENGSIVMLDRYFFATGAYQTVSTGIPWKDILRRNREEIHAPEPDIIFILDLPVSEGLKRAGARKGSTNLQFETEQRLIGVRQAYLEMAKDDIGNYIVIDAKAPLASIVESVKVKITTHIAEKTNKKGF